MESFKHLLGIQSNAEAIYWILAITSTTFFLLKLLLSIFGGDTDIDSEIPDGIDSGFEGDIDTTEIFSLNSVLAFFKGAGWIGVICYRFTNYSFHKIIIVTFFSGVITFIITIYLLKYLKTFETSGTLEIKNAIGNVGTVYLTIPGNRQGKGQIQVEIQGRLATLDAMTDKDTLKTGEKVLVCYKDIEEDLLIVTTFPYDS